MKSREAKRPVWVYAALAANLAIALAKFVAAAVTSSAALVSEGIHSTADTANELLLLLGIHRGRRPADAAHPYGHGKELYFWSLIVAVILFGLGGGLSVFEGLEHLLHPRPLEHPVASFIVLGVAFVFESTSLGVALGELKRQSPGASIWRAIRASKDPSVFTIAAEDMAALAGLLLAFIGVSAATLFHEPAIDAWTSVCIGALLAAVAVILARESRALLVGESGTRALVVDVRRIAEADRVVCRVEEPLTMQLGPTDVLLNLVVRFADGLSSEDVSTAVERIEASIQRTHPEVTRVFIEPARPVRASEPGDSAVGGEGGDRRRGLARDVQQHRR
ncbi:MAG TPA: cation diffusion facilitator family transporter [Polyangiaceae bacterium]|nr:cation diffusion facilitator family transporter [Polyangiaceae bacterium]